LAGRPDPNEDALNYMTWLLGRVKIVDSRDGAMRAGELKKNFENSSH